MNKASDRLGQERYNKQGYVMKVVEYNNAKDIVVEFKDDYKTKIHCQWQQFDKGTLVNPYEFKQRLNENKYNNQGCLMKIIEYNNYHDIIVEFQDKYKAKVNTTYDCFYNGEIRNPYHPTTFGVGVVGAKYPIRVNGADIREYVVWNSMLCRCYDENMKKRCQTYEDVTCCEDWLYFENFYEWLHSQSNFDKWYSNDGWHLDKDIIVKGNKDYNPDTCCLVPQSVNVLFVKREARRGEFPIGVSKNGNKFRANCNNPFTKEQEYLGNYDMADQAFLAYKKRKENLIKQVAELEYSQDNITKACYDAMMNYEVEITD